MLIDRFFEAAWEAEDLLDYIGGNPFEFSKVSSVYVKNSRLFFSNPPVTMTRLPRKRQMMKPKH